MDPALTIGFAIALVIGLLVLWYFLKCHNDKVKNNDDEVDEVDEVDDDITIIDEDDFQE